MRLLFDENLSFRLVRLLADVYPGSMHAREVGLLASPDERLWRFAAEHGLLLVSKDTDFYQRSLLFGPPPKVIWLRVGNAPTATIVALLRDRRPVIERFVTDEQASFLPLFL